MADQVPVARSRAWPSAAGAHVRGAPAVVAVVPETGLEPPTATSSPPTHTDAANGERSPYPSGPASVCHDRVVESYQVSWFDGSPVPR